MNCPNCSCELDITLTVVQKPLGPVPKLATEATRAWFLTQLNANPGESGRALLLDFLRAMDMIGKKEQPETVPLKYVPTSIGQLREFMAVLDNFANGEQGKIPLDNTQYAYMDLPGGAYAKMPIEPVPDKAPPKAKPTGWRAQVIHLTRMAGKTLGQLSLEELQSWDAEFHPLDHWIDGDGVKHDKKPESIAKDKALRDALDQAAAELGIHP